MRFTTRDLQARVAALGFHPGPIDGLNGPRTHEAVKAAMRHHRVEAAQDLFHPSGLHRIHWHWTAGAYGVIGLEADHYNFIVDKDGGVHDGTFAAEAQATYAVDRAASHTFNANTGAIGVSCDAMSGAQELPFRAGSAPLTWPQLEAMADLTAKLCAKHWIPVSRFSTLSHAEIQPTLGVRQRFKWDICWLPDMERPGDPIAVGDRIRQMVAAKMPKDLAA